MEFTPEGATVYKIRYKEILGHLRDSIHNKHPELWRRKNWLLLHDNAPAHRSVFVQEELARQQVTILPHPPYLPDLPPCDFSLFPHMKVLLLGHRFHSTEEIIIATREAVRDLLANMFHRCFQQLYQRWKACIAANVYYFEEGCGSVTCTPSSAAFCESFRFLWVPTRQASVSKLIDCSSNPEIYTEL